MELKKFKLKDKIKEVAFSSKELCMFKKRVKAENPHSKVCVNDVYREIYVSAKRALRDALMIFFGMLFFHVPFIVTEVLVRRLDFLFLSLACIFFIYLVVYISGKLRNVSVTTQYKLITLAIKFFLNKV